MADLVLFTGSLLFTGSPISPQLSSEIIVLVVILVLALCLHLGGVRHLRFGRCGRFETELLLIVTRPRGSISCALRLTRYRRMVDDLAT